MRLPVFFLMVAALALAQTPPPPAPARRSASATPVEAPLAKPPRAPAPAAAGANWRDLKFPPLRPVTIPKVETATLPNGMKIYLLEDRELPLVNGVALIRTGNLFDPPDKIGLATLTGMVLRTGGTRDSDGDTLDEQLEGVAASIESEIGETSGTVSFSALRADADMVMRTFRDLLTAPEFREDKLTLAKTQLRGAIARRNDEPEGIASREFASLVYGRDNPYGWRMEYEHLDRITRADLVAFHQRYFFPANVRLAVYGDFSAAEMKDALEKLFAGWTAQGAPVPPFPPVRAPSAAGVHLAVKNDVTQTFFEIGHLGGQLDDPDFAALQVMADILGGGFSSRLFRRIRTALGAAYAVSAAWDADYRHPGLFRISGSTKSASTTDTFRAIEEEIEKLRQSQVTDEELRTAKDSVLNSFVFNFDTRRKTIGRMLTYDYFGYPPDFIFQYQKAVAAVTKADVQRVARERLKLDQLVFVAVGKPADFVRPLEALNRPVKTIDLTIPEPKQTAAAADAASLALGRKLLTRLQQALGGAEALAAVKDWTETAEFRFAPEAGGLQVAQVNRWLAPSHFRQELAFPFGKIQSYCDGEAGWLRTPQGSAPLLGEQLKQAQDEIFRAYFWLPLSDRHVDRQVNAVDENTLEISDRAGRVARLKLDPDTGLPASVSFVSGSAGSIEERYAAFEPVAGILYPRQITIIRGGSKFADVTVKEVTVNTGIQLEDLKRRPI
jgi:zinc protease